MMKTLTPELLRSLTEQQKATEKSMDAPAESHGASESQHPSTEEEKESDSVTAPEAEAPSEPSTPPKNGIYIERDYAGKPISKATYKDGKLDGPLFTYGFDGVTVEKLTPYQNGVIQGLEKTVYPNGQLQSIIPYKDGKKEGTMATYDEEGQLSSTCVYVDDKAEGIAEVLGDKGEPLMRMTYKNGHLNGPTTEYEKGIPCKISFYENGILTTIQTCDSKGDVIQTQEMKPVALS